LKQGKLGRGYGVGYSQVYANRDSAVACALRDAAWRMACSRMVYVEAEQGFTEDALGKHFQGERYRISADTAQVKALLKGLKVLDVAEMGNMLIVLAGKSPPPPGLTKRTTLSSSPPGWIFEPPKRPGWIYAVGVASRYFYLHKSWAYAEKEAYLELARIVGLKVWDMAKAQRGWGMEGVQVAESRAVLSGVEVVARWEDVGKEAFYVLVRVPFSRG